MKHTAKPERVDLVQMIQAATAEDKAQVDARIDEISKELESLRLVQKLLDVKLNGKPERKAPQKRQARAGSTDGKTPREPTQRERVYDYLSVQGRPVKPATIASDTGIPVASVYTLLSHEWFKKTEDGWAIA